MSELEEILDKHLRHRNPADMQCRAQLIASIEAWAERRVDAEWDGITVRGLAPSRAASAGES